MESSKPIINWYVQNIKSKVVISGDVHDRGVYTFTSDVIVLKYFEKEGVVKTNNGNFLLKNPDRFFDKNKMYDLLSKLSN